MYSNVCDEVRDFEVCGFLKKKKKLNILKAKHCFF